jgi:hypothetical protein
VTGGDAVGGGDEGRGGGGGGAQAAVLAAAPGGGSSGSPVPSGSHRQPSTTAEETREPPGPMFEYDHDPLVPWKYAQYAYLPSCMAPQPSAGTPSMAHKSPDALKRG